jgi:hypothetical protein
MYALSKFKDLIKGYFELFGYLFSSKKKHFLNLKMNLFPVMLLLGLIGVLRNILEVYIGGEWAREWFALTPDIFLTMFFYPIFLCFFSATLLHFFSNRLGLKIKMNYIFSVLFFIQITHIFIPFFDGLAEIFSIPYNIVLPSATYANIIFTPLALSPLIIFFTKPTSLGIDIVWIFVTFILIKLYWKEFKFSKLKSLLVLSITFYIIYISIYPTYYFFLNEMIIGSNYMFGLFFIFISIPSVMYVKSFLKNSWFF